MAKITIASDLASLPELSGAGIDGVPEEVPHLTSPVERATVMISSSSPSPGHIPAPQTLPIEEPLPAKKVTR